MVEQAINPLGKETVQTLQNQYKTSLSMVYKSSGTISWFILSLADWIMLIKRIDLYNKSRVMGDYQARFCERLRVKFPLPTRPADRYKQP